ncbi:guanylate-binding protein 6-like [Sorex araneus]|uniref:guanylate-binding protein 6-like n=1 Tax=Sorex araneus TaxID=42254 RepID=UPI002433FE81|nr:guanylate-binding protein 6-like [Sorex araneus]
MASGPNMMTPICLVENKNERLSVNQEALQILQKISQPAVVVAIVGLYRTGKSYLMNCLAGQKHGFPLGSTVQSKTKGIWMWCLPHPSKPDQFLILLDTEGLGDVEKEDPKNDSWIFALAILLCSSFVYNSVGTINHQALEQLHYVTELTELIKAKSSACPDRVEDSAEFVGFFPDFIWTVRDFTLELKIDGQSITEDEYLENALKLSRSRNPQIEKSNSTRECTRHFFPKRKCFVFNWPVHDKDLLANIENVPENQLDPQFLEQTKKFCSYIFTNARIKTLKEGVIVTGKRLSTLVVTYVDTISSGTVPCLENAVATLAQIENSAAVKMASDLYSEQMTQKVKFPTETVQELLDMHATFEKEAIVIFMKHSFKDEKQEFQKELVEILHDKRKEFLLQNEKASVKYCQAIIEQLSKALMESISAGAFFVSGGHTRYMKIMERIKQDYMQVSRKGVKSNEVFQNFLKSQEAVEKSILQSDTALTEGEKVLAEERTRRENTEKEHELFKQKQQEQQQLMEAEKKTLQENIVQLEQKFAQERENLLQTYSKMLQHKLKVQEAMLNEGFSKRAEAMNSEINQLEKRIKATQDNGSQYTRFLLENATKIFASVLSSDPRILVNIVRGMKSLFRNF